MTETGMATPLDQSVIALQLNTKLTKEPSYTASRPSIANPFYPHNSVTKRPGAL
jgi:hypothetical protein